MYFCNISATIPNDEVYLIKRIYSENKNFKGLRYLVVPVKR